MAEKLNKKKYLHKVIILAWLALGICLIIKLFGGNLFYIVCNNKIFIKLCAYADTHSWLDYLLSSAYCLISTYFFVLAVCQKTRYKIWEFCVVVVSVLGTTAVKIFWSLTVGAFFDIWLVVIMPAVFLQKQFRKYLNILIANILLICFQVVSMYIKNVTTNTLMQNDVVGMIYSIDVLIMLVLYFSYANLLAREEKKNKKEEKKENG